MEISRCDTNLEVFTVNKAKGMGKRVKVLREKSGQRIEPGVSLPVTLQMVTADPQKNGHFVRRICSVGSHEIKGKRDF